MRLFHRWIMGQVRQAKLYDCGRITSSSHIAGILFFFPTSQGCLSFASTLQKIPCHIFFPILQANEFEALLRSFRNLTFWTEWIPKISPESFAKSAQCEEGGFMQVISLFGICEMNSFYVECKEIHFFNGTFCKHFSRVCVMCLWSNISVSSISLYFKYFHGFFLNWFIKRHNPFFIYLFIFAFLPYRWHDIVGHCYHR